MKKNNNEEERAKERNDARNDVSEKQKKKKLRGNAEDLEGRIEEKKRIKATRTCVKLPLCGIFWPKP